MPRSEARRPTDPPSPGRAVRDLVGRHRELSARARGVLAHVADARARIAALAAERRDAVVRRELAAIPVDRLGALTDRNLRLPTLEAAGHRTALDLLDLSPQDLDAIPGVGPETARGVSAAVDHLARVIGDAVRIRITPGDGPRPSAAADAVADGELLAQLHLLLEHEPLLDPHRTDLQDYTRSVETLLPLAERAGSRLRFLLSRGAAKRAALDAAASLAGWEPWLTSTDLPATVAALEARVAEPAPGLPGLWADFERRSVAYYAVLHEIVPVAGAEQAAQGLVAAELAERIAAHPLDQSLLRSSLRGYQEFGARFALNQGRVLLGDEMGLGKTVQAIAVMADRAAGGATHFLVVCPASVLVGWEREVAVHSRLSAVRVHGADRERAAARWLADGGVAVTTFDGLEHLPEPDGGVELVVVDEAHYVKNPRAQRSQEVARWTARTWRVLLMTGTPMQNRLEEFLALVELLQPDLVHAVPRHLGLAGADAFRRAMAPVYLRRNQVDVLVELPELVVVDEWEVLEPAGEAAYRDAVERGSFMAMRRAAFAESGAGSGKLERLLEIVADAAENGHRVVVFSWFRDVIDLVARAVDASRAGTAFGPLTGSVPAGERQDVVDAFSAAPPGAVLVAQVLAGGVGLNIQAASVVVLCEPQVTPAMEHQAVARVHRMGQVRTVVVHRLLVAGGVDERIREILGEKDRLFDEYVRDSALGSATIRAVDVSQTHLARDVVAQEQARLGYGPVWDGLADDGSPSD